MAGGSRPLPLALDGDAKRTHRSARLPSSNSWAARFDCFVQLTENGGISAPIAIVGDLSLRYPSPVLAKLEGVGASEVSPILPSPLPIFPAPTPAAQQPVLYVHAIGAMIVLYAGFMIFSRPIVAQRQHVLWDGLVGILGVIMGDAATFPGAFDRRQVPIAPSKFRPTFRGSQCPRLPSLWSSMS
jgi:hypothetical protein